MRFPLDRNLLYDSSLGEELLLFERHNSQSREFIITFPFTGKTVRQLNNSRSFMTTLLLENLQMTLPSSELVGPKL